MNRTLLAAGAVCLLLATAAWAEPIVISSGGAHGYYHQVATRLATVLDSEYDTAAEVVESNGSLENLGRLLNPLEPASLALVQADALHVYEGRRPGSSKKLVFLTDIGRECAFLVAGRHGAVDEFKDLRSSNVTLAIPTEQSGARVTFAAMKLLDPQLWQTRIARPGGLEALLHIKTGQVDAALFVQRPRAVPPIEIALENQDVYRFVSIPAEALENARLADDTPTYTFETVDIGFGRNFSASVDTVCTRGLLLGSREKLSDPAAAIVARALVSSGRYILPGTR